MVKAFFEDKVIEDQHGKRPKNYDQLAQAWGQYAEAQRLAGSPVDQLILDFHYNEDYSEVCIESNQPLENFIVLPAEVKKKTKKDKRFTK